MEVRDKNIYYIIPLIGGILCVITLFTPISINYFSYYYIIDFITLIIMVSLEEVSGIIILIIAVKLKRGKTTWIEQKRRLLALSLLALIIPIVTSIIVIGLEHIRILMVIGLTGGFLTLLAVIFSNRVVDGDMFYSSTIQESVDDKGLKINKSPTSVPTLCNKCGTDLKEGTFKFCPECGNELTSE